MIQEAMIRKLVDYILLNACSVNSSGYYSGKAGMALALFEAARYLQDEYMEEQAFDLLQEALLSKTNDISFENGLSGIGYTLLYLIENNFIEADFDELYHEQFEKIITNFNEIEKQPSQLLMEIRMIYFLAASKRLHPDERVCKIIRRIFEANELYLVIQFSDFRDINYISNKNRVLEVFENYLKAVYDCKYSEYSRVVLSDYAKLYRSGRIISSFRVAYYLEKLDVDGQYKDVIESNSRFSMLGNLNTISLRSCMELEKLTADDIVLSQLTAGADEELEKIILQRIPQDAFKAGYEQGISRLLIYVTNKSHELL